MRYLILLLLPLLLFSLDFKSIIKLSQKNLLLQSKQKEIDAKKFLVKFAESKNYPMIEAKLNYTRLKDNPTAIFHLFNNPTTSKIGTKDNYSGEVDLIYPIFEGYLIENLVNKSQLEYEKTKLEKEDLERNIYLKLSNLYANIYALKQALKAKEEASIAINKSYKKANAMFKAGLLDYSNLANIQAQKYQINASIQTIKSSLRNSKNLLSYMINYKIKDIGKLPNIKLQTQKELILLALKNRADIKVIKKLLKINDIDLKIVNSENYPTISLVSAIKSEGDDIKLNGNGYSNPNKSYIGIVSKWKLYSGGSTSYKKEAIKAKKMSTLLMLKDYKEHIKVDLENDFNILKALKLQKNAIKSQLKAQKSYYKLTLGKFETNLASADELSRAISNLANIKAKYEEIKSKIFMQKNKILLNSSLQKYKQTLF